MGEAAQYTQWAFPTELLLFFFSLGKIECGNQANFFYLWKFVYMRKGYAKRKKNSVQRRIVGQEKQMMIVKRESMDNERKERY